MGEDDNLMGELSTLIGEDESLLESSVLRKDDEDEDGEI
jgi:hypothetical protein